MISGTRYRLDVEINLQAKLAAEVARMQSDISNKVRIQTASDDPAAAARVAEIRRAQANETQWAANADGASALAARVDTTMDSISSAFDRAIELVTSAANGTLNDDDRAGIAAELRGLAEDINTYAAQKDSRGQPLFPDGAPLAVPVGNGVALAATASRAAVFGVATAGGTVDMATILTNAAAAIENTDATARATAVSASLTAVQAASTHISSAHGEQGVRAARIEAASDRFDTSALNLKIERSGLEDTDLVTTTAKLQASLLTLEAAQAAFARLSQTSLFKQL